MALFTEVAANAARRVQHLLGDSPDSDEALSEMIRAEVHARGHAPRAVTLARVARLLAPVIAVSDERLGEVCDALEREGDLVLASGGILYATPTRGVPANGCIRLFGSLPTRELTAACRQAVDARGSARSVSVSIDLEQAMDDTGGVVVDAEAWSGIDRIAPADAALLELFDHRLHWEPCAPGALDRDGQLEWSALDFEAGQPRWRRRGQEHAKLWKARTRFGYYLWAWSRVGEAPSSAAFVQLTPDEAARAVFAVARAEGQPITGRILRSADCIRLLLPAPVPRAEYRYCSLASIGVAREDRYRGCEVDASVAAGLRNLLSERLGVRWQDEGGGADLDGSQSSSFPPPKPATEMRDTSGVRMSASALDEEVPEQPTVGPLLRSLGVRTYRDLLSVQLTTVRERRGVGRGKVKVLADLVAEAQRRLTAECPEAPAPVEAAPPRSAARFNYDDWSPLLVLGPLVPRVRTVLARYRLETIGALKAWHGSVDPERIEGYGRDSHAWLGRMLERLEVNGHEAIVFHGPAPANVLELAKRFIDCLDASYREIFNMRFVDGMTLEQVGQRKGVTRERIRQIVDKRIEVARPSWRPRAREILGPGISAVEQRGGAALTETVLVRLSTPPDWACDLVCSLADVSMSFEIIPGMTSLLPRDEFLTVRRQMRTELGEVPKLSPSIVETALSSAGFSIPAEELPRVSDAMFGITIEGDIAYPNRRSVQHLYLKVLRDAQGPITAEEVARRVNELDPSMEATKNTAVQHFSRLPEVLSFSRSSWIHEDYLPVTREMLDELVQRCLPEIEAAGGRAISARSLRKNLIQRGEAPKALTANLLRDALLQSGKVRGWRAGVDVAWLGGDVSKTTIDEWIQDAVAELCQPFEIEELIEAVGQRSGYLRQSIAVRVYAADVGIVPIGGGQYVGRRMVWPDDKAYQEAIRCVVESVRASNLRSAENPALRVSGLEAEIAKFGPGIVWGLASKAPGDVATRERGLFIWPAAAGSTLWDVIAKQFLVGCQLFKPAALRDHLFAIGLATQHVVYNLLQEGIAGGYLCRVGMGWHIDSSASFERKVSLLDEEQEVRQLALGSQDFVRESPLRQELNEVRARHGAFAIPAG